jgi:cleavage and polyadenylation specificity factor subunit 1
MQCYTELTPPTSVTHSLSLPFTSATASNLVVAKTSLIQIFALKTITAELDTTATADQSTTDNAIIDRRVNDDDGFESSFLVADSALLPSVQANITKLVLVAEYAVSGAVTSMARIKTPDSKSGGEAILLGFLDAKLSLVEWDPERYGLSTISIHYYEQEEMTGSPWDPHLSNCINYLTADPGSRCAALKFGVRNLAILPFRQGDEDITMDDWAEELDGPRPEKQVVTNGDSKKDDKPYTPSFVLRLSSLDPALIHPIHLDFLYEYREPTFGILSSTLSPSSSLLDERKDHLSYMVFTLDLHQKASTTILVVTGLPYDLFQVIPIPAPIGGALLVGGNELIHIDQSGKANGIAVNAMAKRCTSFGLADHSELDMRLEGCAIEQLSVDNGEMLVVLNTGALAILSFRMDGRSVSGLNLRRVSLQSGGLALGARASCASSLGRNCMFIGSEDADSIVLGWSRKSKQAGRRRSQAELDVTNDEDLEMDDIDDDDDLYGDVPAVISIKDEAQADSSNSKVGDYLFRVHDSLLNIAPLRDVTLSEPTALFDDEDEEHLDEVRSDLELVAASGRNESGCLAILKREVEPKVIGRFEFPEARGIWTLSVQKPIAKALQAEKSKADPGGDVDMVTQFDRLMIVSKSSEDSPEESDVYALTAAGFEALSGTEFEPAAGATIEAGTLGNGARIIQVLRSEVRSYDGGKSSFHSSMFSYQFEVLFKGLAGNLQDERRVHISLLLLMACSQALAKNIYSIASMEIIITLLIFLHQKLSMRAQILC